MNTKKQIVLSAALLGVALGTVGLYSVLGAPADAPAGAAGHDHSAMAVAGEGAAPVRLAGDGGERIGVTYTTAALRPLRLEVRTVGAVTYDETRLTTVNPRIDGWIERLHVDFTGAPVRAGQPLMDVYSPMLVSAQEELLLARRLADEARAGGSARAVAGADELLDAARRRLRYWDVAPGEIAAIERSGSARRTVTLRAPASGIVVEKAALQGSRIMPGMELFRIADLSTVWVEGEVFEKDLGLVRLGQSAQVGFEAYPGETFTAVVSYIHPTVSLEARTGRIRLELPNPGLRLKPGMYAQVVLHAGDDRQALLVPRTAVHHTGTRSLVFVRHGDTLMPHEVVTGTVAGADVEVLSGIDPGMEVVTSANFLIDAESNMGSSLGSMPGIDLDGPDTPAPDDDVASGGAAPVAADPHAGH